MDRQPTLVDELAGAGEMLEAASISCMIENEAGVLPNALDAVLAWAVREGTTNVIRHSRANHCQILLGHEDEEIYAEITDDLSALLSLEDDIEIVAEASRGDEILPAALNNLPDVALLDIDLSTAIKKLGARNRVEAARPAERKGWL